MTAGRTPYPRNLLNYFFAKSFLNFIKNRVLGVSGKAPINVHTRGVARRTGFFSPF
jgi:hypothetical protein